MATVREALTRWMNVLQKLPPGTEIQVTEEGATPGAGASLAIALLLRRDMSAAALDIKAGTYDEEPRIFAEVFEGNPETVDRAVKAWKRDVEA